MNTSPAGDWKSEMVQAANSAAGSVVIRERSRNPMLPNNFLDVSDAGFPSDLKVMAIPIPRSGVPQELAQYRDITQVLRWLHVPWDAISQNGGLDGKPTISGVERHDLGAGQYVAKLPGYFLMFASRKGYEDRRALNTQRAKERVAYKTHSEEETDYGVRRAAMDDTPAQLSIDDLIEYEKQLGDEPARTGH